MCTIIRFPCVQNLIHDPNFSKYKGQTKAVQKKRTGVTFCQSQNIKSIHLN